MNDAHDRYGRCETHGGLVDEAELVYIPETNTLTCLDCEADRIEHLAVTR